MGTGDLRFTETLRDGRVVTIRAMEAADRDKVAAAVRGLDRQSIYLRLFSFRGELTEAGLDRIMRVNPERDMALIVTLREGAEERPIASGRYVGSAPGHAEIAFMVDGDYKGLGIAGRILRHLADIARGRGVQVFEAEVLAENGAMLAVFAKSGLVMRQARQGSVVHVTLAL